MKIYPHVRTHIFFSLFISWSLFPHQTYRTIKGHYTTNRDAFFVGKYSRHDFYTRIFKIIFTLLGCLIRRFFLIWNGHYLFLNLIFVFLFSLYSNPRQKPFWIAAHFYETLSGWKWNYVAYCVRQYFHDMFKSFGFRWKENSIIHVIVNLCKNLTPYLPKYQKENSYNMLKRKNSKILLKMTKQCTHSIPFSI